MVVSSNEIALRLSVFSKEVVAAYKFLAVRFSREYLFTVPRKKLNQDLIDVLFPVPVYGCSVEGRPGLDILYRVKNMCISPAAKSFFLPAAYIHASC